MKKAEEYIDISKLSFKSKTLQVGIIEEWIKQAQIDAIEETCKVCAEEAYAEEGYIGCSWSINEQSILSVADKLKKELE